MKRTGHRNTMILVGAEGFEPTTSSSQSWRSTRLSYTPAAEPPVAVDRRGGARGILPHAAPAGAWEQHNHPAGTRKGA